MKNNATSNIKTQILSSLSMNDVVIYLGNDSFKYDIGVVNLHPKKGTHWVLYIDHNYFDSYGCPPPKNFLNLLRVRIENVFILNIEVKKDGFCASFVFYIIHLTKIMGLDFKSAVLYL